MQDGSTQQWMILWNRHLSWQRIFSIKPDYYVLINNEQERKQYMGEKVSSRNEIIDIVKGISIICIVLGHLGYSIIVRFVYPFHVPIFFIITGYFITNKNCTSEFCKRKASALLLPYFFTGIVMIVLNTSIAYFCNKSAFSEMTKWTLGIMYGAGFAINKPFQMPMAGAIWFLWSSFWGGVILRISLNFRKIVRFLFLVLLFVIGYWTSEYFWLPFSIQAGMCASLFMYIGYLLRTYSVKNVFAASSTSKIAAGIMSGFCYLYFVWKYNGFIFASCDFGRFPIDIILSLLSCLFIYLISEAINWISHPLSLVLQKIGRNTLLVLCLHNIQVNCFSFNPLVNNISSSYLRLITEIVLNIIFFVLIGYIISRSKKLRKLFNIS